MTGLTRLSPMTSYYLRKLLGERQETLINPQGDQINIETIIGQIGQSQSAGAGALRALDGLVQLHQTLATSYAAPESQLVELERQIFSALGLQAVIKSNSVHEGISLSQKLSVGDCITILQKVRQGLVNYIGTTIVSNYLLESRPEGEWWEQFTIDRKQGVIYTGNSAEQLTPEQQQRFDQWVNLFTQRCAEIISDLGIGQEASPDAALFPEIE
jgi:hypothetical protein